MKFDELYPVFEVYGCNGGVDGTETLLGEFKSKVEAVALLYILEGRGAYDWIRLTEK